jgi:putative NIF3 family GTP cyclohydrolase 1 type 2
MVLPRSARASVIAALRAAHPYEEPGFDVTEMVQLEAANAGLGRVGVLAAPLTAIAFARHVSEVLPGTAGGVRITGDPHRSVQRVAVCGGAGSSLLPLVADAGVDAFVTADLNHHAAAEFAERPGAPTLVDVSHWASEWPWLPVAAELLATQFGDEIHTHVSVARTDPWTTRAESPPAR